MQNIIYEYYFFMFAVNLKYTQHNIHTQASCWYVYTYIKRSEIIINK